MQPIRATLAIMAYGGVSAPTLVSAIGEVAQDSGVAWRLYAHIKDAAIDRARSSILSTLLDENDQDAVIMVDHDIEWRPGDAARVVLTAVATGGVAGALVSKRGIGQGFGGRFADGKPHAIFSEEVVRLPSRGFVGGAFTAVSRVAAERVGAVLERNRTGWLPFYLPMQVDGEYLSEDWAFCRRCHDAGVPVLIDMHPQIAHHGSFAYTLQHAANRPDVTHVQDEG